MTQQSNNPVKEIREMTYGDFIKNNKGIKKEIGMVYFGKVEDGVMQSVPNPLEVQYTVQEIRFEKSVSEKMEELKSKNVFTEEELFYIESALQLKNSAVAKKFSKAQYNYVSPSIGLMNELKQGQEVKDKEQAMETFAVLKEDVFYKEELTEEAKENMKEMVLESVLYQTVGTKEDFEKGSELYELFSSLEGRYRQKEFGVLLVLPFPKN